ncbi:MAG: hypothetical protein WA614_04245 [Acidimicrobiales bacterium]|jgi:hypothetical protein
MTRSTAWNTIRGRRRAHHSLTSTYRGPRFAALIATERVPTMHSDSLAEWKSLEFRNRTRPSDEDWYR